MKKNILSLLLLVNIASADFIRDDSKEVVLDTSTNLIWQDNNDAKNITKTWEEAITYCENLDFAGYTNWHLPNFNELYYLADRSINNPALSDVFDNVRFSSYWSSTTFVSQTSPDPATKTKSAWIVSFDGGYDHWYDKRYGKYVRCVRAGQ